MMAISEIQDVHFVLVGARHFNRCSGDVNMICRGQIGINSVVLFRGLCVD